MRVIIAGGGTGGHVIPALAVADQLRIDDPGGAVLFVGAERGLETRLVPARGYDLETLPAGRLKGAGLTARLKTVAGLPRTLLRARRLLEAFEPHAVVGVGGYASAPVVLAAALGRLPVVLLEQNAIPGLTNRGLSRLAARVVISFEHSAKWFPPGRAIHLGNPLPPALVVSLRDRPTHRRTRCLLVLGGSQGARRVNDLVTEAAPALREQIDGLQIIHQTGEADRARVEACYARAGMPARVEAFIEDTASAYRDADFVVGRAGATTLAELAVAGLPAALIPYPHAADDHQSANARFFADAGGAVVLAQAETSAGRLAECIAKILTDGDRLAAMGQAMRRLGRPDAAREITHLIAELAGYP